MAIGVAPNRVLLLGTLADGIYSYVTTGTSQGVDLSAFSKWAVFAESSGGTISTGVLTIEEADYDPNSGPGYGGTWSAIGTIDLTALDGGIAQAAYHSSVAAYAFVRVRISTDVTGTDGGVIVTLRARE